MRKAGRVEIEAELTLFRPAHPVSEVLRFNFIAIHRFVAFKIDGVQVEAFRAGDQPQRQIHVGAQFVGVARASRIVAGGLNAAGQRALRVFKAAHVVALPAVHGNRNLIQLGYGGFDIDAGIGKSLFRQFKSLFCKPGHKHNSLRGCFSA